MAAVACVNGSVSNGPPGQKGGNQIKVSEIKSLPLFRSLPDDKLLHVVEEAQILRQPAGTTLFRQGEMADFLYVVLDGQVGLAGVDNHGEETIVEIVECGSAFIEAAVLMDLPYLMTAQVLVPSRILLLPAARLRRDLLNIPELAVGMLNSVSMHFRTMVREIKELKLKTANQRLGSYMLSLTDKTEGGAIFRLPHNKGLVAARVGVRRETLSRLFTSLRGHGVVVDGPMVSIIDISSLAQYCQQPQDAVAAE